MLFGARKLIFMMISFTYDLDFPKISNLKKKEMKKKKLNCYEYIDALIFFFSRTS